MPGVSEFVRQTLAYLSNGMIALLTLLFEAVRFRPMKGALRCKVRHEVFGNDVPDGRILLFLASTVLAILCTGTFSGFGAIVGGLGRVAIGADQLSKITVITAAAFYFTSEWTIARSTRRSVFPGRRGRRNRSLLRFLVAGMLLQLAVYEPLAVIVVRQLPPSWFELTGDISSTLGSIYDGTMLMIRVVVLIAPFTFLHLVLERSKALQPSSGENRLVYSLPLDLFAAATAASLLTRVLYPTVSPKIVNVHCRSAKGSSETEILVEATFINPGDRHWIPSTGLRVNLLKERGAGEQDHGFEVVTAALCCGPGKPDETSTSIFVGPQRETAFRRRVSINNDSIDGKPVIGCSLSTDERRQDTFDRWLSPAPDEPQFVWVEVAPSDYGVGHMIFDEPATQVNDHDDGTTLENRTGSS